MDSMNLSQVEVHLQNVQAQISQLRILQRLPMTQEVSQTKELEEAELELQRRLSRLLAAISKLGV